MSTVIRPDQSSGTSKRPGFDRAQYSAEHEKHIELMDWFMAKVAEQEQMYVAAGFDAEGLAAFLEQWFSAWAQRSTFALSECLSDDLVFADPIGGARDWTGSQLDYDLYAFLFRAIPDFVFYPQAREQRALPLYDFHDGQVRLMVPWRAVGRMRFTPRTFDWVGVDRYNMARRADGAWQIERIDTDADLFYWLGQMAPIKISAPRQATVHRAVMLVRRVVPGFLRSPQLVGTPSRD